MATLDKEIFEDEKLIELLFNDLDSIQEGFLSWQSIELALKRKAIEISEASIKQAFVDDGFASNAHLTL